jgi:ATPase subunit of ABC transporter with duplicated ATPase domains
MINVSDLALACGRRPIFRDVDIELTQGSRHGMIGANGFDESAFLSVCADDAKPRTREGFW